MLSQGPGNSSYENISVLWLSPSIIYKKMQLPLLHQSREIIRSISSVLQQNSPSSKNLTVHPLSKLKGFKKMKEWRLRTGGQQLSVLTKLQGTKIIHHCLHICKSCRWWWSWIFWFIHPAHAIWAWECIYGIVRSFELKSLGITMSSHIQHLPLEGFPSGKLKQRKIHQYFFYASFSLLHRDHSVMLQWKEGERGRGELAVSRGILTVLSIPFHSTQHLSQMVTYRYEMDAYPILGLSNSNANFRLSGLTVLECPPYRYLLWPIRKWGKFPPWVVTNTSLWRQTV